MIQFEKELEEGCFKKFESDSKIGLLATVSLEGYPHVSLITSIMAKTKTSIMWGQFSRGLSKTYLAANPKTGFLVVSPDMFWWTGKALHRETVVKGDDYELYNNKPLFRYNSYFGIGAVHYEDLADVSRGEKLPLPKIVCGALAGKCMKTFVPKSAGEPKIPPFGMKLAGGLATLKFVSWIDADGYPRIIPALQGVPVDKSRLLFPLAPYGELLRQIPAGAKAAVFLCTMSLTAMLLQGTWQGIKSYGGSKGAVFDVEKVYNSMLPVGGYIYPSQERKAVFGASVPATKMPFAG
jgi:hypothetical protein